ncbi:transposase [Streptomyces sp. NPDC001076]
MVLDRPSVRVDRVGCSPDVENRPRPSRLDPYRPCLERRFTAGCTNVTRLHRELIAENAPVTYQMVRAYIATLRAAPPQAPPPPPTVRRVTGWLTRHPAALSEHEHAAMKDVLARCPELDAAAEGVRNFGEILTCRLGSTLPAWIDAVEASQLPGLTGCALHLLRDLDAVTAGLTLHWSSGGTEGAVDRIKKIKGSSTDAPDSNYSASRSCSNNPPLSLAKISEHCLSCPRFDVDQKCVAIPKTRRSCAMSWRSRSVGSYP